MKFWVIDTEGNGANPNEPIELGAAEMQGLELTGRMHVWRFKPIVPITFYAKKVHGIRNRDLRNCPRFEELAPKIRDILGDLPVIGHAIKMELDCLEPRLPGWKPDGVHDTLKIARRMLKDQKQHNLRTLAEMFDLSSKAEEITGKKSHNALYDAVVTGLLCKSLRERDEESFDRFFRESDLVRSRIKHQENVEKQARKRALKMQYQEQMKINQDLSA